MKLALARPGEHPISQAVKEAGWEPVHFPLTRIVPMGSPPPQPFSFYTAVILLSPSAAWALNPWLVKGAEPVILAQGQGTEDALEGALSDLRRSSVPTAEGIWELVQREFPGGGNFLLARAERSRGYLEEVSQGTPWRIWPWITHREEPNIPLPPLPAVDAVLALSPLQAELLGPLSADLLRFGWGARSVFGYRKAGLEATAVCEPRIEDLKNLLREQLTTKARP